MKRKTNKIFLFIAIIGCVFALFVMLYSNLIYAIEFKDTLRFGAEAIALLSINVYNYLEKGRVSVSLILPFSVIVMAFIVSFI